MYSDKVVKNWLLDVFDKIEEDSTTGVAWDWAELLSSNGFGYDRFFASVKQLSTDPEIMEKVDIIHTRLRASVVRENKNTAMGMLIAKSEHGMTDRVENKTDVTSGGEKISINVNLGDGD